MPVSPVPNQAPNLATELRKRISDVFGLDNTDRIVLTPGILVGLHVLSANLGVRKIAVTTEEYHSASHFPSHDVQEFDIQHFLEESKRFRPHALIVSLVTWKGLVLPVSKVFQQLRETLGKDCPILIADCTHAGAIGFPSLREIGADIVCGDLCKWITPPSYQRNLAFLWFKEPSLFVKTKGAFDPFFLATEQQSIQPLARWIEPSVLEDVLHWYSGPATEKPAILSRHDANLKLASRLSIDLAIPGRPQSSILWLSGSTQPNIPSHLDERGLVWRPAGGGVRILCRSDAQIESGN